MVYKRGGLWVEEHGTGAVRNSHVLAHWCETYMGRANVRLLARGATKLVNNIRVASLRDSILEAVPCSSTQSPPRLKTILISVTLPFPFPTLIFREKSYLDLDLRLLQSLYIFKYRPKLNAKNSALPLNIVVWVVCYIRGVSERLSCVCFWM